jgi:hypothetical protein
MDNHKYACDCLQMPGKSRRRIFTRRLFSASIKGNRDVNVIQSSRNVNALPAPRIPSFVLSTMTGGVHVIKDD